MLAHATPQARKRSVSLEYIQELFRPKTTQMPADRLPQ
jgi:hypothetical protein